LGLVMFLWLCLQMNMDDYPHFFLAEDGKLCSTDQHCPGFPRVLYDATLHLGYNGDAPIYRCRLSMAPGLDVCEVSIMIPFDPMEPWLGSIIGSKPNTVVEMMAHVAVASLCESRLAATATLPIALLPIWNLENPVWQQCLEAMSDLEGPHFNVGMAALAKYAQYLFNLQHNIARTGMQQHMHLTAYEEHAIINSRVLERLRHENAIFCSGTLPPSDQDRELKVGYSEAEHGWNYTRQLLNITREEVDIRTYGIIHLEHAFKKQGADLEERVKTIANLEQQLL
jgi:hypothetical protein